LSGGRVELEVARLRTVQRAREVAWDEVLDVLSGMRDGAVGGDDTDARTGRVTLTGWRDHRPGAGGNLEPAWTGRVRLFERTPRRDPERESSAPAECRCAKLIDKKVYKVGI